ncbi:MAG: restriction endonuclease subunit S [Methylococcaceae bacterium]
MPDNWEWVRTNDICESIVDCPHSTPKYLNEGMNCIDTTCFDERGILLKTRKVDKDTFNERNSRLIPKHGDIVYSREGIIGQAVIIPENGKYCLGQRVMLFRPYHIISSVFFRSLVTSFYFRKKMTENHRGVGAKHINMSDLRTGLIPLPPLAEQHSIVAKVDELMTLCEQLKTKLANAQTLQQQLAETLVQQAVA